jgi:hypothetical protein
VTVDLIVTSLRAFPLALPPAYTPLADLVDSFRVVKYDSAPNRFRFTRTAFHPRGAASWQVQF